MVTSPWIRTATQHDPWDVVIIGGGPAGAIAARQLALQSKQVLLVEKSRSPRFKVCGGCLGREALDVLAEIGLGDLPVRAGGTPLRSMRLCSESCTTELKLGHRIGLSRSVFDALLLEEVVQAGATVCVETAGRLETSGDLRLRSIELQHDHVRLTVCAKCVLVATGLSSCPPEFVARSWPKSRIGVGTLLDPGQFDLKPNVMYMACSADGYVGIAPVEAGRLDVAAAVDPAALAQARSPGKLVAQILREAGLPELATLQAASWRGTPLLTSHTRPLGAHRCLLIGDAAEYVEPFTGEGIGWAMRSAVLASDLMRDGIDKWNTRIAQRWETLYAGRLARQQWRCRLISQLLLRSKLMRGLTVWGLRHAPFLAHSFT